MPAQQIAAENSLQVGQCPYCGRSTSWKVAGEKAYLCGNCHNDVTSRYWTPKDLLLSSTYFAIMIGVSIVIGFITYPSKAMKPIATQGVMRATDTSSPYTPRTVYTFDVQNIESPNRLTMERFDYIGETVTTNN